jgi:hypothetical protein
VLRDQVMSAFGRTAEICTRLAGAVRCLDRIIPPTKTE